MDTCMYVCMHDILIYSISISIDSMIGIIRPYAASTGIIVWLEYLRYECYITVSPLCFLIRFAFRIKQIFLTICPRAGGIFNWIFFHYLFLFLVNFFPAIRNRSRKNGKHRCQIRAPTSTLVEYLYSTRMAGTLLGQSASRQK